jgi:hypothetical protein
MVWPEWMFWIVKATRKVSPRIGQSVTKGAIAGSRTDGEFASHKHAGLCTAVCVGAYQIIGLYPFVLALELQLDQFFRVRIGPGN